MWDEKGEFDKAIKDFSEAIRLDPKNAEAFVFRGIARGEKKDYPAAIEDFTEAINLDPKNAAGLPQPRLRETCQGGTRQGDLRLLHGHSP